MHGDGKSMGVKIRIGKTPSFGKMCFWLLGKLNAWKGMPILLFIHQFCSPTQLGLLCVSLHDFGWFLHFSPWLEICFWSSWMYVQLGIRFWGCWVYVQLGKPVFGVIEWRRSRDLRFKGLRGCFPFPHAVGICWVFSSQISAFSSLLSKLETRFL